MKEEVTKPLIIRGNIMQTWTTVEKVFKSETIGGNGKKVASLLIVMIFNIKGDEN